MATFQNLQVINNDTSTTTTSFSSSSYDHSLEGKPISQPLIMSMFGALNRFISRLDAAPLNEEQQSATNGAYGFQVLRNANQEVPLEPWFDFVIGINGRTIVCMIPSDSRAAAQETKELESQENYEMGVRGCKTNIIWPKLSGTGEC